MAEPRKKTKWHWHFINVWDLHAKYDPLIQEIVILGTASNRVLAQRLSWSESKVSRFVDDLVDKGKVQRVRTGKSVEITPL